MTRSRTRRAAVVAALLFGLAAAAFGRASQETVVSSLEAWYQPGPTSALPLPTPVALPAPSPYPAGTLHVAWASSAETARSYLAFPVRGLRLSAAELTVPLDVDPANGDAQSSTALVRACLATGELTKVEGATSEPPSVDCTSNTVLKYVATPAPHLVGDLAPLLVGLATSPGIALLPVEDQPPSSTWRVTFSAHDRADDGKTPPASLRLTIDDEPTPTTVAPVTGLGEVPRKPLTESDLPPASTLDAPSLADEAPFEVPASTSTTTAPASARSVAPAGFVSRTVGYAYPGLWLLPLVLLVAVPLIARELTKNLEPPS